MNRSRIDSWIETESVCICVGCRMFFEVGEPVLHTADCPEIPGSNMNASWIRAYQAGEPWRSQIWFLCLEVLQQNHELAMSCPLPKLP